MRKRNYLIAIITFLLVVSTGVYFIHKNQKPTLTNAKPGEVREIQYILVKNAFFNETKILKPNAALLITNKDEIVEDQELFLAYKEYAFSAGYDYSIQFWKNSESLANEVVLNSECEIFSYEPALAKKRLQFYKKKLETAPTHYIYNLELSVFTEPKEVYSVFRNSGMKLFFIDDESSRFPSIGFSHRLNTFVGENASENSWAIAEKENKEKSEKIINKIIEKVKAISSVVEQSDIFYDSYGRANNYMTHNGNVVMKFQFGTNLTNVRDIIIKEGAVANYVDNPKYYYVQLLDTLDNLEKVKIKLRKYKIINDVSAYSK